MTSRLTLALLTRLEVAAIGWHVGHDVADTDARARDERRNDNPDNDIAVKSRETPGAIAQT
jgi:hypothetical protein